MLSVILSGQARRHNLQDRERGIYKSGNLLCWLKLTACGSKKKLIIIHNFLALISHDKNLITSLWLQFITSCTAMFFWYFLFPEIMYQFCRKN